MRQVIELSRAQLSFTEGLIQEEVGPLWEDWIRQVDEELLDPELLSIVYEALARRWPRSWTRGRPGTLADVAPEAHSQLESPGARARSASELGVSAVHAGGRRESTRCQDHG
jgi:hypothetical protein